MADNLSKIKTALVKAVNANPNLPITGIVESVADDYCSVILMSGLKLTDVKLKATVKYEDNYLLLQPKVGSTVVLMSLSGSLENLAVIKYDEVEKIAYKQNGLEVIIDSTDKKVSIKNTSVSLVDILDDLATLLKQFKVATPSGPSTNVLPDTIARITEFETAFNSLLK